MGRVSRLGGPDLIEFDWVGSAVPGGPDLIEFDWVGSAVPGGPDLIEFEWVGSAVPGGPDLCLCMGRKWGELWIILLNFQSENL
jgi:hypothetical protein